MAEKSPTRWDLIAAFLGITLIIAAGIVTAIDHIHGMQGPACIVPDEFRGKAAAAPQILDVRAGRRADVPTVELGRSACIIVAGLRSSTELAPLMAAVQSAKVSVADATAQLEQARSSFLAASGDARSAAIQKVNDIKSDLAERNAALTQTRAALGTATQDVSVALYLDGQETPALANASGIAEAQPLLFTLDSGNDAKSADAIRVRKILKGLTSGASRDVVIGVGLPNGNHPLAVWTPPKASATPQLRVYSPLAAWAAGIGFVLLLIGIFLASDGTGLLRDGDAGSAYSLGRTQMAFWMVATVFGFVFIWVLTHQFQNVITPATFTLLGITGATALASRAIDANSTPPRSNGFLTDILSDGQGGPQLHRIQVVIWTLVLGTIFIWNILDQFMLTDFDSNLLILVGIANGVYAGFKTQES